MKAARTSSGLLAVAAMTIISVSLAAFVCFRDRPPTASSLSVVDATAVGPSVPGEVSPAHPLPSGKAKLSGESSPSPAATADSGAVAIPIAPSTATPPAIQKALYQPGPSKFKNAKDLRARNILALVGVDVDAEIYWLSTINDPGIPAKERKDLIEDLNEDGISDPAHPAPKDLGLIASRIALIERLLPSAMDKVNADAFREAQKDLVKMRERLTQQ